MRHICNIIEHKIKMYVIINALRMPMKYSYQLQFGVNSIKICDIVRPRLDSKYIRKFLTPEACIDVLLRQN